MTGILATPTVEYYCLCNYVTLRIHCFVDDELSDDEEMFDSGAQTDDKVGVKKQRKLEEKAAKKAQREVR